MKAFNLYTLTRVRDSVNFSMLAQALSGRTWHKAFSAHETASLCALVDGLVPLLSEKGEEWVRFLDGFYFSYTIEHISKEFDLLKLSADADCVLNIELKSESIEEDRIRKQLEQNRYYLSHIARTILSYTYVMETDTLYFLNDHGYLGVSSFEDLVSTLQRPVLQTFVEENIQEWFRAQDYLISPVANPEKLLTGRYFLTNQQADFRRQILELLTGDGQTADYPAYTGDNDIKPKQEGKEKSADDPSCADDSDTKPGQEEKEPENGGPAVTPVISLTGSAGTGKTLLLFDLAIALSKKKKVLFLHGGPLREGHRIIDQRLHKVTVLSGTESADTMPEVSAGTEYSSAQAARAPQTCKAIKKGTSPECDFLQEKYIREFQYILVDEANRFVSGTLEKLLIRSAEFGIPCIFSYDPHSILGQIPPMEDAEAVIARHETLRLELSGNIRINRPIFSFLRTLFHQKDRAGHVNYDCIDVLYAGNRREEKLLTDYYLKKGYILLNGSRGRGILRSEDLISREYDRVLMVLDHRFYYDESLHLCADGTRGAAIAPLYEGLSRAREKLCLLVVDNPELFSQILAIREL